MYNPENYSSQELSMALSVKVKLRRRENVYLVSSVSVHRFILKASFPPSLHRRVFLTFPKIVATKKKSVNGSIMSR